MCANFPIPTTTLVKSRIFLDLPQNYSLTISRSRSWDAFILLDLDGKPCPLHMSIRFPEDYPRTAPSAGFSCSDFGYTDGAVYMDKDRESYFYGKLIICLDILGNFAKVHDEWANIANSGWSPVRSAFLFLCSFL